MNESNPDIVPVTPPRPSPWRIIGSMVGGMAVIAIAYFGVGFSTMLLGPLLKGYFLFLMLFTVVIWGMFLVIGGAVTRWLAGPMVWRGRLGAITALLYFTLAQLLAAWRHGWSYDPQNGGTPFLAITHPRSYTVGIILFNVIVNGIIWVFGACLAQLGDYLATRISTHQTSPVPPQE